MHRSFILLLIGLCLVAGCANARDDWTNIDYEKVAHDNQKRENDASYTAPVSVAACVDDDLYNCNPKRRP